MIGLSVVLFLQAGVGQLSAEPITASQFASRFDPARADNWSVCRSSKVRQGAKLGAVGTILARDDLFRLGDDENCQVTFRLEAADLSLPGRFDLPSCTVAFDTSGSLVNEIELAPHTGAPAELQKCLFRMGLWIAGRTTALTASDEELFAPLSETRWQAMGPTMPEVVPREL